MPSEEVAIEVLQQHERVFWKMHQSAESQEGFEMMARCL